MIRAPENQKRQRRRALGGPADIHPMIIYDLNCENGHRFEGWFQSAHAFEAQQSQRLVCCPQCDSHDVRRVPSAIAIGTHAKETPAALKSDSASLGANTAVMPAGVQITSIYRQLVQAMITNSEDVGPSFAEEARKIHYNEAPERPIRGSVTDEECESLREEGIPILRLPSIKEEDLN
ncbi:MAG: hypothetical protein H6R18_1262 [Proteobacteria bacterium]|nr:hypothetical protein [Pseudomonadota bacterium]